MFILHYFTKVAIPSAVVSKKLIYPAAKSSLENPFLFSDLVALNI